PIEGVMLVSANDWVIGEHAYFIEGMSDNVTPAPGEFLHGDMSPHLDRVTYAVREYAPGALPVQAHVWTADIDGTNAINLTELAGVEGVSCRPQWSPDGTMIAFQHADPGYDRPCEGFEVWVVRTDGSEAHRVTADGSPASWHPCWSPNGYRLTCIEAGIGAISIDFDGTDRLVLPNVADMSAWSPDGAKIASSRLRLVTEDGEAGVRRDLLLTDADGGNPEVLVSQFVKDSDIEYHLSRDWPPEREGADRFQSCQVAVGPSHPEWSPSGDRIVFQSIMPFDPDGEYFILQVELWMLELDTGDLTKITDNDAREASQSWRGPNTFPDDPEVTVDDVTVTFSDVIGEGVTVILKDDDPPEVSTGFQFDYAFYELNTTAEVTGPISLCMTYTDEEVPPAAEADLAILHWDGAEWVDITTSHDTDNNIICGQTISLSPFALQGIRTTEFPDVPAWGYGAQGLDPYWAYYYVMACVEVKIVGGYEDGLYRPTNTVTRDQMAVYIARSLSGGDEGVPEFEGTASFSDVPRSHWAIDYVEYAVDAQVVGGYEDGTYHPTQTVNRGQMAVFIARALAGSDDDVPEYTGAPSFPDVSSNFWAFRHIEYIRAAGVTQGFGDGLYHPEYPVTRDQMAVYVARAFDLLE
ncbi:MAG: S-layer homology domain-containing protein, partial [Armatimonadetes bacterium]|nr:S-layer homology domain-containing protein [Armatimonadota bacterium]